MERESVDYKNLASLPGLTEAFFHIMVKADRLATREKLASLRRLVEYTWRMAAGSGPRCAEKIYLQGTQMRCFLPEGHPGPHKFYLEVRKEKGANLSVTEAVPRKEIVELVTYVPEEDRALVESR